MYNIKASTEERERERRLAATNQCDYFSVQAGRFHTVIKDVLICGGTLLRLFPDADCHDLQHVVLCGVGDWSRARILPDNSTDWLAG